MKKKIDNDVFNILKQDGVANIDFNNENQLIVNINDMIAKNDESESWSKRIINTDSNSATVICQMPGEGNRRHYHSNWNEWWLILKGEWEFEIEGKINIIKEGQLILIKKNLKHKITAIGNKPAIRLAVSRSDVDHIYD
jgi:quercetin dioxygenase-like cupin family protein|tara:strand:- start:120 stop:536 length:417 start_codon:yes stop_codon:yes gene_type:complete